MATARLARPAKYLRLVIDAPPTCAKCGKAVDGRPACARCGLVSTRTGEFLATRAAAEGAVDAALASAWADARANWDDIARHDHLLALARQHDTFAWLAARYKDLAQMGDALAEKRLGIVQRVVALSVSLRTAEVAAPDAYRSVKRMMALLVLLFALGMALMKQMVRNANAAPSAPRSSERGSAMLVTMIIISSLMAGMAVLVSVQTSTTRSVDVSNSQRASLHCAEAGLASARVPAASNWKLWNAALAAGTEPSWFSTINHDLDGDGASDFELTLRDNVDEGTGTNDETRDNDLTVFVVSTCTKYIDTPVQVTELVRYNGGGTCYQAQLGGCGGNNNAN